ncbi:MAG TPA: zinc-ribbon domain-containing protein, partial [Desulfobacterales bacterium]|nr:zinc-ribbon domain-containing protein [Desulfobacterales bacterium]
MIVMCEGCETNFSVEDRLVKPSGSRVRCSRCRHVFTVYPPVADVDADEPLTLENELPAAVAREPDAQLEDIDATLDALFSEGPAPAAQSEPELLDVDDLLAEDAPAAAAAGGAGDGIGFDLDL